MSPVSPGGRPEMNRSTSLRGLPAVAEPVSATNCTHPFDDGELQSVDPSALIPWSEVTEQMSGGGTWWFATNHPAGRPHVRPVLAVWVGGALVTTAGAETRKVKNLEEGGSAAFTASREGVDLVVEGSVTSITEPDSLQSVADVFLDTYGWPTTVAGDALEAPYGAPSAGPPPYRVFAVAPRRVFAFGTDERWAARSTRFAFAARP